MCPEKTLLSYGRKKKRQTGPASSLDSRVHPSTLGTFCPEWQQLNICTKSNRVLLQILRVGYDDICTFGFGAQNGIHATSNLL